MFLCFSNPVFNEGINCTVRRGTKWANSDGCFEAIYDLKGKCVATAKIVDVVVIRFVDILDNIDLIKLEHGPRCKNYSGLKSEMEKCYSNFKEHEIVTILYFSLI